MRPEQTPGLRAGLYSGLRPALIADRRCPVATIRAGCAGDALRSTACDGRAMAWGGPEQRLDLRGGLALETDSEMAGWSRLCPYSLSKGAHMPAISTA